MLVIVLFASTLLVAVLLSDLASRSILSTSVVFLAAGFVAGEGVLGWLHFKPGHPVEVFLEIGLFTVLFTDGMRVGIRELSTAWQLPGRALIVGMPITFIIMAVATRWIVDLPWAGCFLLAGALNPTDPVLVSAIAGNEEVPRRLRHLLNVESGLNDGLALPVVLYFIAKLASDSSDPTRVLIEVGAGVVIGLVLPWLAIQLERLPFFSVQAQYDSLYAISVGLLVLSVSWLTGANVFLAGFSAGVSTGSVSSRIRDQFGPIGEILTELAKLSGLFVFGALLTPDLLVVNDLTVYVLVFVMLFITRPGAIALALFGSALSWAEILAAGWFGPKGFASAVLGLMILQAGIPEGDRIVRLIALVITGSIILHSSTDVLMARWFCQRAEPSAESLPVNNT
jgi:sodium/hydrogen antiporter